MNCYLFILSIKQDKKILQQLKTTEKNRYNENIDFLFGPVN